jgi:EmrB/QacA subfamily drug resistance transporter
MEDNRWYRIRWISLGFLAFSVLVIVLDNTVLNLALPSISKELGSNDTSLQWIVDAYVLAFAGLLLTMGALGDRFGRKRFLQGGLIVFALFSLGAALSKSSNMLIAMRALMGIGGAAILPATLSILTSTFSDTRERAQAIALWTAVFAVGWGIGPLVGGWLLSHFEWSSVFYINIPIVVIALIGGYFFIRDSRAEKSRRIDILGSILSITGLFALVYGIIQAGIDSWTAPNVLWAFGAAVVLLATFAFWELRTKEPMLPLRFFKNLSFTGANVALTLVSFALVGSLFFLSQYLQTVQGYTPLQAGVRLLPIVGASFIGASLSAKIAQLITTKITVGLGILVGAAGLFYFYKIAGVDTSYLRVAIGMCIIAVGLGVAMSPATNSIMGSIPVAEAGVGSAMNDTTRQVGGALGVAVLGTILNSSYLSTITAAKWPSPLPPPLLTVIGGSVQGAHIAAITVNNLPLSQVIVSTANNAFVSGMAHALLVGAIILVIASITTFIILPARVRPYKE